MKKISTKIVFGVVLLFIIIFGIVTYFLYIRNINNKTKNTPMPYSNNENTNNKEQHSGQYSFIPMTNDMKEAFKESFSTWDINKVKIFTKKNLPEHRFGYFLNNSNQEGYFFATKVDNKWSITDFGYNNPFGHCKNFTKYNYPEELIPDCIDMEGRITISLNPDLFYSFSITKKAREEVKKSFIEFINNNKKDDYTKEEIPLEVYNHLRKTYNNKELSLKIDNNTENNLKGVIMRVGEENHSTPYILATKVNNKWKVILQSQDIPPCELVDKYNIPTKLFWPYSEDVCWDLENKNVRKQ